MSAGGGAALWLVVAGSGAAWALDGNDEVRLELAGGSVVEGRFLRAEPSAVVLSVPEQGGAVSVPLVIVAGAAINGEAVGLEAFRAEAAEAWQRRAALVEDVGPTPHPAVVAGLSMLWAGAGHAALGEWRSVGGYAAAEVVILGTAALDLAQGSGQALPTLIGLDLLVRAWAAQEGARLARRRREIARTAAEAEGGAP